MDSTPMMMPGSIIDTTPQSLPRFSLRPEPPAGSSATKTCETILPAMEVRGCAKSCRTLSAEKHCGPESSWMPRFSRAYWVRLLRP